MTKLRKVFFFPIIFLGICLIVWQLQAVDAQTKPLTYTEITTALNTKLPNSVFKNKTQLINWLTIQIKQRKVDKPLTPDREDLLHEAGATDELIGIIRQNSPSLSIPSTNKKTFTNSIGMEFNLIPSGSFMMGSDNGGSDEKPVHRITISKSFYLGKYEVTQEQWEKVMGNNPSYFKNCPRCPVEQVSWEDAQDFIKKLNAKGEGRYRLPTEAEWEYAARAGSTTKYSFGDSENLLGNYAWYRDNSGDKTHAVGTKQPNSWGLYDMLGNVWELCDDLYGSYLSSAQTDPMGAASGSNRVARGGSWTTNGAGLHCASRGKTSPSTRASLSGFRLIKE